MLSLSGSTSTGVISRCRRYVPISHLILVFLLTATACSSPEVSQNTLPTAAQHGEPVPNRDAAREVEAEEAPTGVVQSVRPPAAIEVAEAETTPATAAPQVSPAATIDEQPTLAPTPTATATAEPTPGPAHPELNGISECFIASDGLFTGVNPTGAEITWLHPYTNFREAALMDMVETFNITNACKITVRAINAGSYQDIQDAVKKSLSLGESPPELLFGYQSDQAKLQLVNALADLNPYLDSPVWGLGDARTDFYPDILEQTVHPYLDNQRLGFPLHRSLEILYYNQTWLEELGFDSPPTTPEQFREMACTASAATGDGTGGYILRTDASGVSAWIAAFGGQMVSGDRLKYNYANEGALQALTFLKDLYDDGCAHIFTEGYPQGEFAARHALFTQGSSAGLSYYESSVEAVAEEQSGEPDKWGIMALPHTTTDPSVIVYSPDVIITHTTPEQQLASWVFVKWITLPQNQSEWIRLLDYNYLPSRRSTQEQLQDYEAATAQWETASGLLNFSAYEPPLASYGLVRRLVTDCFNTIVHLPPDVGTDNIGPIAEALAELTRAANEIHEAMAAEHRQSMPATPSTESSH